jgi:G3E family GTPase
VDADILLGHVRFDANETLRAAAWLKSLASLLPASATKVAAGPGRSLVQRPAAGGSRPAHEAKYGIRNFVYQARRPFAARKFFALVEAGLPGLLRAKGYFWTQERPDEMGFLSVAGGATRYEFLSYWWAALVENGRVGLAQRPELIAALWAEPHGDRRQELVFIGVGLDEPAVRTALDGCLIHD